MPPPRPQVLWRGQLFDKLETDKAALKALTAVDNMWNVHLEHLRKQNCKALQTLQDKHEEALTKMRLQQVWHLMCTLPQHPDLD